MRMKRTISVFIFTLVLVQLVAAQELATSTISITVSETGRAFIALTIPRPENVTLYLPYPTEKLEVFDKKGPLSYFRNKTFLTFSPTSNESAVTFSTDALTSKSGSIWTLNFTFPTSFYMLEVNIYLPSSIIRHIESYPKIEPFIELANKQITISWLVQDGEQFSCAINYQPKAGALSGTTEAYFYYLLLALGLISLAGVASAIYLKRRKVIPIQPATLQPSTNLTTVLPTLDERERKIIDELLKFGGKTTQAKLYYSTGIPKATLHRTLKELERKNIIKLVGVGKTNLVEFSEWALEKKPFT